MSAVRGFLLFAVSAVATFGWAAPPDHAVASAFRDQQWLQLSERNDRDSVTAAIAIAMPIESDGALPNGFDAFEQRVANEFKNDPQVLFALANVCQQVDHHCPDARYYDALIRVEPQNAVNWLLLPDHAAPDAGQLRSAASAQYADSNLRTMLRVVRTALAAAGDEVPELIDAIAENAPLPQFRGFVRVCKSMADAPIAECVALAQKLIDDRSGALLTRMIASATLQRMMKGTPEDVAAKQMRRDYVWLDEHSASLITDRDDWQESIIRNGEWEAMLHAADSAGIARVPPPGWMPRDPHALLLSEERTLTK